MFPVPGRLLSSHTRFFPHNLWHDPSACILLKEWDRELRLCWQNTQHPPSSLPEGPLEALGIDESPASQSCQLTEQTLRAFQKEQSKIGGVHRRTHLTTLNIKQAPNFNNFAILKDRHQCHPTPTIHQGISLPWALVTKYNISLNILFILAYVLGNTLILENWLASSF